MNCDYKGKNDYYCTLISHLAFYCDKLFGEFSVKAKNK